MENLGFVSSFGITTYLANLMACGADHAYRQLAADRSLNWRGLSVTGRVKTHEALVAFASVHPSGEGDR